MQVLKVVFFGGGRGGGGLGFLRIVSSRTSRNGRGGGSDLTGPCTQ